MKGLIEEKEGAALTDDEILSLFFQRDEAALEQTRLKYGAYCGKITAQILENQQDCEECWNETLLRVWNAIPPQKPGNFKLYLAASARNLAFSYYRKLTAQKRGGAEVVLALEELSECAQTSESPEDTVLAKDLGGTINRFLETLSERERNVFLRRYFFTESTQEIARRYGLRSSNVLMILSRTRKKLKLYLRQEGYLL
jgi:RNA polymerase sigma-70 factor (ECF subfamily)